MENHLAIIWFLCIKVSIASFPLYRLYIQFVIWTSGYVCIQYTKAEHKFINTIYLYLGDVEIHTLNIYMNVYICVVCTYVLLFRWNELPITSLWSKYQISSSIQFCCKVVFTWNPKWTEIGLNSLRCTVTPYIFFTWKV